MNNKLKQLQGDMSVESFAIKCQMGATRMRNYILGRRLDEDAIKKICTACGVSADWLLGLDNNKRGVKK